LVPSKCFGRWRQLYHPRFIKLTLHLVIKQDSLHISLMSCDLVGLLLVSQTGEREQIAVKNQEYSWEGGTARSGQCHSEQRVRRWVEDLKPSGMQGRQQWPHYEAAITRWGYATPFVSMGCSVEEMLRICETEGKINRQFINGWRCNTCHVFGGGFIKTRIKRGGHKATSEQPIFAQMQYRGSIFRRIFLQCARSLRQCQITGDPAPRLVPRKTCAM
jgi:hypothetical protein